MSAVALALQLVPPGGRVLAAHDCYGGTYRLLRALASRGQIELELADLTAPTATEVIARCRRRCSGWRREQSAAAHHRPARGGRAGRRAGAIVVADNTSCRPHSSVHSPLSADIVVHSTTKYLNGHSDVGGRRGDSARRGHLETLAWWATAWASPGAPFDSYLTLRGVRTLFARMRVHEENAARSSAGARGTPGGVGGALSGLSSHAGHAVAAGQQAGFGGMVSFTVPGGIPAVRAVTDSLCCFTLAESLGGVESLIAHPATMTHASMDPEAREWRDHPTDC